MMSRGRSWLCPDPDREVRPFGITASMTTDLLTVSGELDLHTAPMLIAVAAVSRAGHDLTIDVTRLQFIDAAGIDAVAGLRAAHRNLRVIGASARIHRTFELARAQWLLPAGDVDLLGGLAAASIHAVFQARGVGRPGRVAIRDDLAAPQQVADVSCGIRRIGR